MRKFIVATLAATAALLPAAAMAQPGPAHVDRVVTVDHRPGHRASTVTETRFVVGGQVQRDYISKRYYVGNPGHYRLPRATARQRWIRVHDDAVLVNVHNGRVIAVRDHHFR